MKRKREQDEDDLVTLVLVKWSLREIFYCFTLLIKIINQCEDWEERRFLDETLIQCSIEREVSLCCFINEVYQNASHFISSREPASQEQEPAQRSDAQREFIQMLRGLFVLLLVYDTKVQRFILTNHKIHRLMLRSKPPGRTKANQFIDKIVPQVNAFLSLTDSLQTLSSQSQSIWANDFMLQRFQEPPYENSIPRIDHQQIWWTRVHIDSVPYLSELDQLGF